MRKLAIFYYSAAMAAVVAWNFSSASTYMLQLRHAIVELVFALLLASIFLTATRLMLLPYMKARTPGNELPGRAESFVPQWIRLFSAVLLVSVMTQLWFMLHELSQGSQPSLWKLTVIFVVSLAFGASVMFLLFRRLRDEIQVLSSAIRDFGRVGRNVSKRRLTVAANDEIGQLAHSFNRLQRKSEEAYRELEEDLRVASFVRSMLLPKICFELERLSVKVMHESAREIGGDFYDVIPLADGRVVIGIGEVSAKGLPAALIMSSALVMMRVEAREGGTAREMLERVTRGIEKTQRDYPVSLGLLVICPKAGTANYASLGLAAPLLIQNGYAAPISAGSMPSEECTWKLRSGDRCLMYTSSLVERFEHTADGNGLNGLLYCLNRSWTVEDTLQRMRNEMDGFTAKSAETTALLLEWHKPKVKEEKLHA